MNRQYALLKFMSKKEYAEAFMDGDFYMNSLYYFWNEYMPEDPTKHLQSSLTGGQGDSLEGTVSTGNDLDVSLDFYDRTISDTIYRSVGYKYCNVLCFYKLYIMINNCFLSYDYPDMGEFGDYVIIVKDPSELIRRFGVSVEQDGYHYLCGSVRYRPLKRGVERSPVSEIHHLLLKAARKYNMEDLNLRSYRDCFIKMDDLSYQNEWRIALYRGEKNTDAYQLKIGSIRDIATYVKRDELGWMIEDLFHKEDIKPGVVGFEGNVSRRDMKRMFYKLGDNKVEKLVFTN